MQNRFNQSFNCARLHQVFLCLFIALISNFAEGRVRQPQLTEEQKAAARERELKNTELKIGHDCQPRSLTTKIYIKTLNDDQLRYFWLGQRYAVERSYYEQVKQQQIMRMNNAYDNQIAALERRRDEANLMAMGIKPFKSAEIDKALAESDALLATIDADMERSNREWARRCYQYSDERSR